MNQDREESPLNALPAAVVMLALVVAAIEIVFQAGAHGLAGGQEAVGWRLDAIGRFAFSQPIFDWMRQHGIWPVAEILRLVAYPFVHVSFMHAFMVIVFLLALGKAVGDIFGSLAVLAVFFVSAIVGALVFWVLTDTDAPLVGGYPAAYGLIGSYTFLLWVSLTGTGNGRYRAFTLIGLLVLVQLFFGARADWVADLAGFGSGFAMSFLLVPGATRRFVAALRRR